LKRTEREIDKNRERNIACMLKSRGREHVKGEKIEIG
jgi:hypothetical protein